MNVKGEILESFEIYSNSVGLPSKPKNGDHVGHLVLEDEGLVVLAVADGVGEHFCDWDASQTTIRSVLQRFEEGEGDLEPRMAGAVEFAHQEVQNLQGESAGAISTLVMVVWEIGEPECRFVSVGDSRVYRVGHSGVDLLTEDDSRTVPVKRDGKIVIIDGAAAFSNAITAAVGTREPLDLQVETAEFPSGGMMALTSDGCHELAGFQGFVAQVFAHPELKKAADTIVFGQNEAFGKDDATLALLRRTDFSEKEREKYLKVFRAGSDFQAEGLLGHFMVRVLADHLNQAAGVPDSKSMVQVLDYLKERKLQLTKGDLSKALGNLKDDGEIETKRVWDRLVGMVLGL